MPQPKVPDNGVWDTIMDAVTAAHDSKVQMIDTSVVRVHQHAACIKNNKGQQIGRSRGGLSTKVHAVVDGHGLSVRLGLTSGETHDNQFCVALLSKLKPSTLLLADRGYDADWIRDLVGRQRTWANIPRNEIARSLFASVAAFIVHETALRGFQ